VKSWLNCENCDISIFIFLCAAFWGAHCSQKACNWVTKSSKYLLPVLRVISLMMLHRCGIILFVAQSGMIIYAKYMWAGTEISPHFVGCRMCMICIKFRPFHLSLRELHANFCSPLSSPELMFWPGQKRGWGI